MALVTEYVELRDSDEILHSMAAWLCREMEEMPVGYPAEDARVPDLKRKDLDKVSEFFE